MAALVAAARRRGEITENKKNAEETVAAAASSDRAMPQRPAYPRSPEVSDEGTCEHFASTAMSSRNCAVAGVAGRPGSTRCCARP